MKIIHAHWEKRNLGVQTVEVEIKENDTLEEVKQCLSEIQGEYIVVKIPTHMAKLSFLIQEYGFYYVEDMALMSSNLKAVQRNSVIQRLYDEIISCEMDKVDYLQLYQEIRKGLFSTDRVSIDPMFTKEQAAERYIGWIHDELEKGTSLYKYVYRGNIIGFFALKEIAQGRYTSFLGGIYLEYRKGGIGSIVKVPETVKKLGGKRVETYVSLNNLVQVRSLLMNGYTIEKNIHVFIKHSK